MLQAIARLTTRSFASARCIDLQYALFFGIFFGLKWQYGRLLQLRFARSRTTGLLWRALLFAVCSACAAIAVRVAVHVVVHNRFRASELTVARLLRLLSVTALGLNANAVGDGLCVIAIAVSNGACQKLLALLVLALLAFAAVLLVLVRSRAWMTDALYGSILVSLTVYGTMAGYLNIHGNKLDDACQHTQNQ